MPDHIYYDSEELTSADVAETRRVTSIDRREFAPVTTNWPEEFADSPPQRVPASNDPSTLADVDDRLSTLIDALETVSASTFRRHGISLFDVARFQLLFATADVWQWTDRLHAAFAHGDPGRLVWVTDRIGALTSLQREMNSQGKRFELRRCHGPRRETFRSRWHRVRDCVGAPMRRLWEHWEARGNATKRFHDARPDVLFTDFFPNSVHAVLPLKRRIREHGLMDIWLPARGKVADVLERHQIDCELVAHVASAASAGTPGFGPAEVHRLKNALARGLEEVWPHGDQPDPRTIRRIIGRHLLRGLCDAAWWLDVYHHAFRAVRPRSVVCTSYSGTVGRAAAVAARLNDAVSIYVQHGLLPAKKIWFRHWLHDVALVWGEFDRRNFARWGDSGTRFEVTGSTLYDAAPYDETDTVPHSARDGRRKVVAYLASRTAGAVVTETLQKIVVRALADSVRALGQALVIKPHPGDATGLLDSLHSARGDFDLDRTSTSREVIDRADVVVVVSSTTGLEACVAGKPLLVLACHGCASLLPYHEYGAAVLVPISGESDTTGLHDALCNVLESDATRDELRRGRKRLIDDMLCGADGRAAVRATEFLAAACRAGSS